MLQIKANTFIICRKFLKNSAAVLYYFDSITYLVIFNSNNFSLIFFFSLYLLHYYALKVSQPLGIWNYLTGALAVALPALCLEHWKHSWPATKPHFEDPLWRLTFQFYTAFFLTCPLLPSPRLQSSSCQWHR